MKLKLKDMYKPFLNLEEKRLVNIDMLVNFLQGMFKYSGHPDTFRPEFFERYLMTWGQASACEDKNGNWWACTSTLAGDIDPNGLGNMVIVAMPNLSVERYIDDPSIAHCWNNPTHSPTLYLGNTAELLSEIELSLDDLVIDSRQTNGLIARNEKVKIQLENYYKAKKEGRPYVMFAENLLEDIIEKNVEDVLQLDLSNKSSVHDFQFLINAHDSVLRWFLNWFGHGQQNTNKLAQQTVDEIKDSNSASLVLPTQMLEERKKFVEDFNRKTGGNMKVEFSDLWKNELDETMGVVAPEQEEKKEGEDDVENNEDK